MINKTMSSRSILVGMSKGLQESEHLARVVSEEFATSSLNSKI